MKKIGADQAALRFIQFDMRLKSIFHLRGARLEDIEQVPVTTVEVFKYVVQLLCCSFGIEPNNPADDMVGPRPIGWVEISGFSRRFEGPDDDPRGVRTQI
jgi:hypothetical protein